MGESPNFPVPIPKFWGQSGDGDKVWKNFGDFSGTGMGLILSFFGVLSPKSPKNGDGDGDRTPERFGDTLGTGKTQSLGIFWGKIPKKPQKTGRGRGKDSRGFCPP